MEKGGGGGGGSQDYTKKISSASKQPDQSSISEDCYNVNIRTTITHPVLERLIGVKENDVLQLNFPERLERIEILNHESIICGYVTSSVKRLCVCHDKGYQFEVFLQSRNNDNSFNILVRNRR